MGIIAPFFSYLITFFRPLHFKLRANTIEGQATVCVLNGMIITMLTVKMAISTESRGIRKHHVRDVLAGEISILIVLNYEFKVKRCLGRSHLVLD